MGLTDYLFVLGIIIDFVQGNPLLLLADRRDILVVDAGNPFGNSTVVISGLDDAAAVDYYFEENLVFFTDVSLQTIKRIRLDNSQASEGVITSGLVSPDGLACDWLSRKLYWTDSETNRIELCDFDGNHRKVLFWEDMDQPRAIALDPVNGFMYWTDWGEMPKIERAGMNGDPRTREVIVSDNIHWPNGLTIDYDDSRIFWADAKLSFIHSCDFDGSHRRAVVSGQASLPHPFALTLFRDTLFWTDWEKHAIHSCDKKTGANSTVVHTNIYSPMDIHVYHRSRQPTRNNPCGRNNGGCSHLCLMAPYPPFYSCACPTGVRLLNDSKTCALGAKDILILARRTDIRIISLDMPDYTDVVLSLGNIRHAIAIDYDPLEGYVYWTDDEVRAIYRAHMDGSGQEMVVNQEIDHPDGIAVDWVARNIYWTDTGNDRIEVARLNGTSRKVLISEDLEEPRAIALNPMAGLMYWTDWGKHPKIERANLDGTDRMVFVNTSLGWPNGLALDMDNGKVYWADAKTDKIEMANLDGSHRKVLVSDNLPHIFGFSLLGDYIYWTDWQRRAIERVHKVRGDERTTIVEQLPDLMGLKAAHRMFQGSEEGFEHNLCYHGNGGCSHLCLNRPSGAACACPMGYELQADKKTCIVPEAFLLFTQKEFIRIMSLESRHNNVVIPVSGIGSANALDYDINDNRVYWTDIDHKSISRAFMNGSAVEEIVEFGLENPEGMAVDWVARNIYWADMGTNRIEMARLDGSSRRVLIWKDVQNPRNIALDPPNGYIYWTEWGEKPRIKRANLNGTNRVTVVPDSGRAHGLAIDYVEKRLYWTNMEENIIESANMSGGDRLVVVQDRLPHPSGLTQYQDFIFWTDWNTGSIERANKSNGSNRTQIQGNLGIIMDVVVFHTSRQSGWNSCGANNGGCAHLCISHPLDLTNNYTHHCACPTHYELDSDNKSCIAPETFLLFSQKNSISRISTNVFDSPDVILPIQGLRNIKALAFDPVDRHVYWIDGRAKTIRRSTENGTSTMAVVPNPQPQDQFVPYDLAIDPYARMLYWTDSLNNVINVTRLDTQPIGVIMSGQHQKPRSIALAPEHGYMFWTNMVKPPVIVRAKMDGTARVDLFTSGFKQPGQLAVDEKLKKLYWTDTELKRIEMSNFDGSNRRVVVEEILRPVSLTVFQGHLYWIDEEQQLIKRIALDSGKKSEPIKNRVSHLTDIIGIPRLDEMTFNNHSCSHDNGGCSHICYVNSEKKRSCSCPLSLTLTSSEMKCEEPPTCKPEEFTCLTGNIECVPKVWQCDGIPECEDESDERGCPTCSLNQFTCRNGECISSKDRCNGKAECPDKSDEEGCPPCLGSQFLCTKDQKCIRLEKKCDHSNDCSDGEDEDQFNCNPPPPTKMRQSESTTAQYTVGIIVGMIALIFVLLFAVFACRRKGQHIQLEYHREIVMVTKPLNPNGKGSTPPHTLTSSHGKSGTTVLTLSSQTDKGAPTTNSYDRNHVTGASSSSSMVTHYPKETLNPPPSPVTDRSLCTTAWDLYYSSQSLSTVKSCRHYRPRHLRPPPTTPCSTDVCEDSEPYSSPTRASSRYYHSLLEYDSDPFDPPPPTPRSHYLSEVSCPPSPSTERSFFSRHPHPPPPSPAGHSDCERSAIL